MYVCLLNGIRLNALNCEKSTRFYSMRTMKLISCCFCFVVFYFISSSQYSAFRVLFHSARKCKWTLNMCTHSSVYCKPNFIRARQIHFLCVRCSAAAHFHCSFNFHLLFLPLQLTLKKHALCSVWLLTQAHAHTRATKYIHKCIFSKWIFLSVNRYRVCAVSLWYVPFLFYAWSTFYRVIWLNMKCKIKYIETNE